MHTVKIVLVIPMDDSVSEVFSIDKTNVCSNCISRHERRDCFRASYV